MADSLLAPDVLSRVDRLREEFAAASPFQHLVVDGFLRPDVAASMLAEFPAFDERGARDENGEVGGKSAFENVCRLGPTYREVDRFLRSEEFLDFVSRITGIEDLLYDPLYYGGGTHENRQGQELDPHVDFNYHGKYGWHRRLNLIVYLNPEWEDSWGGSLELHSDPWSPPEENQIRAVAPLFNRCVLFETTESSWHGFQAVRLPEDRPTLSRRSFAIYLYTRTRPAECTAPEHDTVYVERPLPPQLVPGHVLTAADRAELERLLTRRDRHLQRLYARETRFSQTIRELRDQLDAASGWRRAVGTVRRRMKPLLYRLRRRVVRNQ